MWNDVIMFNHTFVIKFRGKRAGDKYARDLGVYLRMIYEDGSFNCEKLY